MPLVLDVELPSRASYEELGGAGDNASGEDMDANRGALRSTGGSRWSVDPPFLLEPVKGGLYLRFYHGRAFVFADGRVEASRLLQPV